MIATKGEFTRCCEVIRNQNIEIEILVCVDPLFNVIYRVAIKIAWLSNGNELTHLPLDRYFADIFKRIFMNEMFCILIQISLKSIPKDQLMIRQHWFR